MWYKFWTFKNPIFSTHFYSGVCWLLSPTFDSPFSTSEHLYFLPSPSLPNPILWISVGVWAMENTRNIQLHRSVSLLMKHSFLLFSSLSPSSLSSSCNSVNLSMFLMVENLFTINIEVLLSVLYSWRSLQTIGRIKLKSRGRRLKPKTWENQKTPDYTEH